MRSVLFWFFAKFSEFLETSLTWKIYGDFSFTHLLLGAIFVFAIFKFFGFVSDSYSGGLSEYLGLYKNIENKKDKENYTHYIKSERHRENGKFVTTTRKYKVHKKTGEVIEL